MFRRYPTPNLDKWLAEFGQAIKTTDQDCHFPHASACGIADMAVADAVPEAASGGWRAVLKHDLAAIPDEYHYVLERFADAEIEQIRRGTVAKLHIRPQGDPDSVVKLHNIDWATRIEDLVEQHFELYGSIAYVNIIFPWGESTQLPIELSRARIGHCLYNISWFRAAMFMPDDVHDTKKLIIEFVEADDDDEDEPESKLPPPRLGAKRPSNGPSSPSKKH